MDQVELMFERATENRNREVLDCAIAVRAAMAAEPKDWQGFVQSLSPKKEKDHKPRLPSKEEVRELQRMMRYGRK